METFELPKLSAPAHRALAAHGIASLNDLASVRESEIKKWHGLGPSGIRMLKTAMTEHGLAFADDKSGPR